MEHLLNNILEKLNDLENQTSEKLWTCSDIADFLQLSKSSIENRVVCRDDFPKPMIFGGTKQRTRRWNSFEVKQWSRRQTKDA